MQPACSHISNKARLTLPACGNSKSVLSVGLDRVVTPPTASWIADIKHTAAGLQLQLQPGNMAQYDADPRCVYKLLALVACGHDHLCFTAPWHAAQVRPEDSQHDHVDGQGAHGAQGPRVSLCTLNIHICHWRCMQYGRLRAPGLHVTTRACCTCCTEAMSTR